MTGGDGGAGREEQIHHAGPTRSWGAGLINWEGSKFFFYQIFDREINFGANTRQGNKCQSKYLARRSISGEIPDRGRITGRGAVGGQVLGREKLRGKCWVGGQREDNT